MHVDLSFNKCGGHLFGVLGLGFKCVFFPKILGSCLFGFKDKYNIVTSYFGFRVYRV